ncbi:18588_t:CDS:2 [Funneliformis geosporum]|uniref:18588_t:CDS:1 n=1 Tax=Funneliformis geosporum TaxID=1117311 RepID=A0A9W4SEH5_9GLOM|nr:18588_t:CDS:2 [Funneliformis geosporum]
MQNLSDNFDEEIIILDSAEVIIANNENEIKIEVIDLTSVISYGKKN